MKPTPLLPDFNRSQRRGIFILLLLIFTVLMFVSNFNRFFPPSKYDVNIPEDLQQQYDSLKNIALQRQKPDIYPFNPNYLSDYKGYVSGLSPEQIDKITAYRKTGKYFQTKQEFKEVAGLSDSLFAKLEPYIKIHVFKTEKSFSFGNHKSLTTNDINKATVEDLQNVYGVGPVLSKRIVKYRNLIGGFNDMSQLEKVYGLEPEVVARIKEKFVIKSFPQTQPVAVIKKPINTAAEADLKQVYGIGDKLARRIVKYRQSLGGFTVKEQLNDVYGLKPETIERLWERFEIKNPAKISQKINLNDADIKQLAKNPYITYQLAKKIVSYRTLNGAFHNFDDLLKVPDYPADKHKKICLYLKL